MGTNPYDNAQAESFIKTLKHEEVYLWEYVDLSRSAKEPMLNFGLFLGFLAIESITISAGLLS